jgi:putative membrane protein
MSARRRRLHPAGIVLGALGVLREAALPLVVAFVAGVGTRGPSMPTALALALLAAGGAALLGYLRWRRTTWWVGDGAVHLRSGVLSPDDTVVPVARVQAIDTTQGPVQRLFGVLEVGVQAAGGGTKAQITLGAVTAADVRALRAATGLPEPAAREVDTLVLSGRDLLVTALTAPQLGVLLPLVAGVGAIGDDLFSEGLRAGWFERLPAGPAVALVVVGLALVAWLLSILGAVVAFSGFRVQRDGARLSIRRGLLQRRAASVPLRRVHAVRLVEGVLRQPFGLATLRLETAGYRNEPAAAQTLFPLVRRADADALLARFVPELAGALGPLKAPPRRALRRYVLPEALAGALAGAALTAVLPAAWPAVAVLAALGAWHGALRFRAAGWRLDSGRVVLRSRGAARQTIVARAARLQEQSLAQTLPQRRARLAHLAIAVGSGRRARVAHLDLADASALFQAVRPGGGSNPSQRSTGSRG